MQSFLSRLQIFGELFQYLWKRKLYWLLPMMVVLTVVVLLIAAGSSGGLGPLVYTIF